MENIYIFLKNVILDLKQESKQNTFFIFILILLISIPLPFVVNNIALGLLILHFFLNFKKTNFKTTQILIFPVAMFFIMAASYFWSIDKEETLQAIPKEISLLLIPLMFMKTQISINQKNKLIKYFSYSMVIMAVFFLLRAIIRYLINYDSRVFFYHGENDYDYGLVPKTLNAIHVSVFVAVAFFYFFTKEIKLKMDSGEISRDELMREATDIMQKMKGMGSGGEGENNEFSDILKNLTKGMSSSGIGSSGIGSSGMNDILKNLEKIELN